MRDFKKLNAWQKAHQLVLDVYEETRLFPPDERFGLTNQVRRSAASIPANIAEGAGRGSDADYARFINYALGSANETEYHIILAHDLRFLPENARDRLIGKLSEIRKMTTALSQTLRTNG